MTREEQISNGFTEMMKGFWGNQDLKVPDFEEPCKQEPCEDKRLYIKVFADLEPDDIAEKIYQICDEDKLPKVIESLKEYFDSEPCNDYISRQAVIDMLECLTNAPYDCKTNYCPNCGAKMVVEKCRTMQEILSEKGGDREEAINRLRDMIAEIRAICDESKHMSEDDRQDMETFDMAIKALEQEPFINKPCVSEGVCREDKIQVLDKIRAELIQSIQNGTLKIESGNEELFRIINKYKAESEG